MNKETKQMKLRVSQIHIMNLIKMGAYDALI